MRKWLLAIAITCAVIVVGIVACLALASLGVVQLAKAIPTSTPGHPLTVGRSYWVNALLPPIGVPAGFVSTSADIYNKPGNLLTDPSITIIATVPDGTQLTLTAVQNDWCYVEGTSHPFRDFGLIDYEEHVEGWIKCDRLLDYLPTPYPTPNTTPQRPQPYGPTLPPSEFTPRALNPMPLSQYDLLLQYDPDEWAISIDQYGFALLTSVALPDCQLRDAGVAEVYGQFKEAVLLGDFSFDVYEHLASDGRIVREYLALVGPGISPNTGKPFLVLMIPPFNSHLCLDAADAVLSSLRPSH